MMIRDRLVRACLRRISPLGQRPLETSCWVTLGYCEAVKTVARDYLTSLTDADLSGSVVAPPANEPRPVSDLLGILVFDNVVHGGQIAYLRGYYEGMGWFA